MKIVAMVARLLLGLMFVVFGLNGFLNFIPSPGLPPGPAGQFAGAMMQSHYMTVVSTLQILGGLLLLAGRFVPLGLTILGPIIVNIVLFHVLMMHAGLPIALLAMALWLIVFYSVRRAFSGIFLQRVSDEETGLL